jgi:DNA polymerase III beta subunit, central domain
MRKVEFERMQDLRSMITAVAFAASTDEERRDMNGVGLEVIDGELHARATNGQWAMRVRRTPSYAVEGFKVLVPLSYVKRLVALIGADGIGRVQITQERDLVRFEVEKIGRLDLDTGGVAAVPFVDIDKVWPTGEELPMGVIGFKPGTLPNLAKAFGQLAANPTLRFAFHGDDHPIVVTCEEKECANADALLMPCILEGASDDDDEEDGQRTLFPEPETSERVARLIEGVRNAVPGGEVTISSGGRSVKLKGKTGLMSKKKKKKQ